MNGLVVLQQKEDISRFFNGPGRTDVLGMHPLAMLQQGKSILQYCSGLSIMGAQENEF